MTFAEQVVRATIRELTNKGAKLALPEMIPTPKKTVLNDIIEEPTDFKLIAWIEGDGVSMRLERRKEGDITNPSANKPKDM